MKQLKSMKQCLIAQAQSQMGNLQQVDAEELGEVIDMIKDLEEAIYYCTITEAMNKKDEMPQNNYYYTEYYNPIMKHQYPIYEDERDYDKHSGRMYYSGSSSSGRGGMSSGNSNSSSGNGDNQSSYTERELPLEFRDEREGRAPKYRRMYMESKEMHHGKEKQIKDLEKYLQELSTDITEMIQDASPEEKQMLQKKIALLATKVNV